MAQQRKSGRASKSTPVSSVRHHATRRNIPTEELRDFVADDEKAPKTVLYPRDPSLDPQLVWKGKDEQDQQDLAVPAVPIYIQEKIQPQAIIENIRANARKAAPEPQMALFSDFNGISFEDLIDFYHHEQHWSNRMILGDSLMVMASLAEKEGLKGKVQMIYMDPPYGIEFGSNWQVSTRKHDVRDGKAEDTTRQPEQIKAYRDTWRLGIHTYLAYLRDRLTVARDLLTESGSVFLQIGNENVHLVRSLMDEVFGSDSFCSLITFRKKTMPLGSEYFEQVADYILWYAKNRGAVKSRSILKPMPVQGDSIWSWVELPNRERRKMTAAEVKDHAVLPDDARVYRLVSMLPAQYRPNQDFQFSFQGHSFDPPKKSCWKTNREGMEKLALAGRLQKAGQSLQQILFHRDFSVTRLTALWNDTGGAVDKTYVVQTTATAIERCLLASTDPGDLVLDPTCGSGTTAYVAEQWGRRWITVDTSRVAIALARTRLMAGRYPYYLLADSPEGAKKERELAGTMGAGEMGSEGVGEKNSGPDIRRGFVYKRVPHVTLKSIANNDEIDGLHAEWQTQLEPVRAALNTLLKQNWEEWQVPRELLPSPSGGGAGGDHGPWSEAEREGERLLAEWWRLRQGRQAAIDASIARHADTELLYDQPYEDNKRIRVSGPFTVESLSPHRVITTDEGPLRATKDDGTAVNTSGQFTTMILENLKTAGVQNTVKQERLKFDRLEPFAGTWLQAAGE
jgi:adenine-specific DNA-methyltransferase